MNKYLSLYKQNKIPPTICDEPLFIL